MKGTPRAGATSSVGVPLVCSMLLSGESGVYQQLGRELVHSAKAKGADPYFVAICGGPGSGKSTLARHLCAVLGEQAIALPMDGFHYYKRELDAFDDPAHAHDRRGAPFTFNGRRFADRLAQLHREKRGPWPSFSHAQADPVEDDIHLEPHHRIVLVEGNYLLMDEPPWSDVRGLFDERWFVHVPEAVARMRVAHRNAAAWRWPLEKAIARTDASDVPNMRIAQCTSAHADRVIDGMALERGELVVMSGAGLSDGVPPLTS